MLEGFSVQSFPKGGVALSWTSKISAAKQPKPFRNLKTELFVVVVEIMVPFWLLTVLRHLLFRVPQKGL